MSYVNDKQNRQKTRKPFPDKVLDCMYEAIQGLRGGGVVQQNNDQLNQVEDKID